MKKSDALMEDLGVELNHAVLDTIQVIDFAKSRWATVQLYRTGSNRLAYPTVDPSWVMPPAAEQAPKVRSER